MIITRAKYWYEIAAEYDVKKDTLKAMLDLKRLNLRKNQRKLFPKQIKEIYDQLGEPIS